MKHVLSNDGTPIAYERSGEGPAVILVGGLVDRTENVPLAQALAEHFTVYIYDQRGRGNSGDTPPYNVRREIEDLGAVIALAAGQHTSTERQRAVLSDSKPPPAACPSTGSPSTKCPTALPTARSNGGSTSAHWKH